MPYKLFKVQFMESIMKFVLSIAAILLFSSSVIKADVLKGTYKTEPNDEGSYLHVKFGSCSNDKKLTCGTIKGSYLKNGSKNKATKIIGENIVWGMLDQGSGIYEGGQIWDPSDPKADGSKKVYKSKMALSGNTLSVSGCILWICKAQNWVKVN